MHSIKTIFLVLLSTFGFSVYAQGLIGVGGYLSSQENCHNFWHKTGFIHQSYPKGIPEDGSGDDAMILRVKAEISGTEEVLVYGYTKDEVATVYSFEAQKPDGFKCNYSGFIVGVGKSIKDANSDALSKKNQIEGVYSYQLEWTTPVTEGKIIKRVVKYDQLTVTYTIVKTAYNTALVAEGTNTSNETIVVNIVDQDLEKIPSPINISETSPLPSDFDDKKTDKADNGFILAPNEKFQTKVSFPHPAVKISKGKKNNEPTETIQDVWKPRIIDTIEWIDGKIGSEKEDAPKKKTSNPGGVRG